MNEKDVSTSKDYVDFTGIIIKINKQIRHLYIAHKLWYEVIYICLTYFVTRSLIIHVLVSYSWYLCPSHKFGQIYRFLL